MQILNSKKNHYWLFKILFASAVFAICTIVLYRYQLKTEFSVLPGDRYDTVISTVILEHWYHTLLGQANWSDVLYFYPYKRTIAHTDAFFLIGVTYYPFRLIGFDPFISSELAGIATKAIGFVAMILFARKAFSLNFWWALACASLFTLSSSLASHSSRYQLYSMAYVPLISYLAYTAIHEFIIGNNRRFRNFGLMAAILFGALCITSFYVAWFYAYFVLALILIFVVAIGAKGRQELFVQIRRSFMSVSIVVMAGVCALLPFIWAYYPKSLEVGTRSYEGVVRNTIPLEDVLQVGGGNLLFGRFYKELLSYVSPAYSPQHEYSYTGFALPIFFLFIFGVFEAVKKRQAIQNGLLISSIGIATVATWITALNIRGVSLWFIIFHAVPGAKALNMVAAFQIFLVFPVTLVSIWFLSRQNLRLSLALLVVGVLFLGELTTPYLKLDRNIELNRISGVTLPPKECKVFYVDGWRNQENIPGFSESINGHYAHNVTAMLIAQEIRLPTINGNASFTPLDWDFAFPNSEDYDKRVLSYARKHNVSGLCKYSLEGHHWSVILDMGDL